MEFKMTTDLATAIPQEIAFNFEELKAELAERLEYYGSLVVTEDTIKDAKADRANLNKLREAIDKRRKEVKKAYMKPYSDFEAQVKELVDLIDRPILAIDSQLVTFEEKRKEEKLLKIEESYAGLVSDTIKDIIPLERILDPKWLNVTTTMKKIEEEIILHSKRVNADVLALDTVPAEYAAAVKAKYIETLDIEAALEHKKALQRAAEAFREREAAKAENEAQEAAEAPRAQEEAAQPTDNQDLEAVYLLRLELQLTKDQAKTMQKLRGDNRINHKKI